MSRHPFARALAAAALAMLSVPARASVLLEMGLDDLVACSDAVVVATVVSSEASLDPGGASVTTTWRLRVDDALKGGWKGRRLTIVQPGGTAGGITTELVLGARLVDGKRHVLFLQDIAGALVLVGSGQGALVLDDDGFARRTVELEGELVASGARHPLPGRLATTKLLADVRDRATELEASAATCRFAGPAR